MVVIRMTWHIEAHFEEVRKLFTEIRPPESSPCAAAVPISRGQA